MANGLLDTFNNLGLSSKLGLLSTGVDLLEGRPLGEAVKTGLTAYGGLSNIEKDRRRTEALKILQAKFPNEPLVTAYPEEFAKQYLEKKYNTSGSNVNALGLGNTVSERDMGNLITLGKKIQDGTASEPQKILYGLLYDKLRKGQNYSQTNAATGITTTYQTGKMKLTGLPVPEGYEETTTLGTSADYSDGQTLSSGFASMMIKSEEKLNELAGTDYLPQEDLVGAYLGGGRFTQRALSAEAQQFQLSALNFVQAVLRKESGAAISKEEFADAYRRYFPQYGDATGTIDFKRELRKEAIKGMINTSGGHFGSLESNKDFDIETLYSQPSPSNNNASLTQGTIDFGNLSGLSTTDFLAIYKEAKAEENKPPSQRKYTQKQYEKLKQELLRRTPDD